MPVSKFKCSSLLGNEGIDTYHASTNIEGIKKKGNIGRDGKRIYIAFTKEEAQDYLNAFMKYNDYDNPSFGLTKFKLNKKDIFMDWESPLGGNLKGRGRDYWRLACGNTRETEEICHDVIGFVRDADNTLPIEALYPICKNIGEDDFSKSVWGVTGVGKKIPIKDITFI
ncbi:hypothetical protein LCGC14_0222990 [marine sediment metagenome]|uniref:Uncharacterized protein n=1 Tax=marine sediment metagenome TaxID=412755 RepID=A0A0F9WWD1_9ZZZZ|nr:hypothetical protein [bacterium]